MKEYEFPAIFHVAEEGGYWVEFPDLGIFTQGDDLEEAINMAGDCLLCMVDEIPDNVNPTPIENITIQKGEYVKLIKPEYYKSSNN
jgi:predicted RNase H-like HicB family nuclease